MDKCVLILAIGIIAFFEGTSGQGRRLSRQPQCERGSCYPATGDLLIGRQVNLTASSTCGLNQPQRYCVVSYLEKDTKCFTCDSRQPWRANITENSHRIENIVSSFKERKTRWWQAENGKENVFIQLDLEAEFHFTHLIMTFKTFRPKAMLIERSFDFGKTWKVYRYFAQNCAASFPGVRRGVVRSLSDIICEERYSAETPSTEGEVIFRVLPPFIPIPDPYSEEVQDLLKLTNLRINMTELHTLGDTLLDNRREIMEKYYYSVYDMTVRGSCSCYGHASRCLPVNGQGGQGGYNNMVHGQCECTHNTKGLNCEMCQDFYHDLPWRPARQNQPNACKRCNCNNHATECHFDPARYQSTGFVSGGVCDNCQHNTEGVNCQECKQFFYQDPMRDIRDPEICQPCDCDTHGSDRRGLCEQVTDPDLNTVAGRCICKRFVTGPRCDTCIENYWNLREDNPFGCEQCTCNPDGIIKDAKGCDQETGLCLCKRYVTGPQCDECFPGFYGLDADNRYGCEPCDCDIGGALGFTCDQFTGQCQCRPHIQGKQCKEVEPGFYYAHLDNLLYEGEDGRGIGNARVYIREPISGGPNYWTGLGYMKVLEGDSIEFTVNNLPFSTYYDTVIRYDPRMPEVFQDVRVTVIRPQRVDPDGLCGDFSPQEDLKTVALQPGARFNVVSPPSCLETGTTYTIRIDFNNYRTGTKTPEATLLIDSILLVPNTDYIPIYQGQGLPEYMKKEFLYNRCDTNQFPSVKQTIPDVCLKHTFSISAVLYDGALDCDCDKTGSMSLECNPSGGQCECKPNVVGRRCDQCAPGTYGFGPNGCVPCNCHEIGARDNFCNEQTGQCSCITNVASRTCDRCRANYWGFPQCRQCQCNGNADSCDPLTGKCISCRNFTAGDFCERCADGYYGDPRIGMRIPCQPCMCPGGPGASIQHADSCSFNPRTQQVVCNCLPGYSGPRCETCIDNYFGDPTAVGGTCEPCICNNNIDNNDPGSCDAKTGECLKCLYNTEGTACEHCRPGYHGNATQQNCARCICNSLGTDTSRGECDRVTGQCPCLPNVVGQDCSSCGPGHWNLTSGTGCAACGCDPTGSISLDCNQITGQCGCLPGRGGQKCADCEDFQYGDPKVQCYPCECNPQGSANFQCNRRTGQCECVKGVTGHKCDRCARGTTGDLPNCVPCGECFDNWDEIIQELRGQTHDLVKRAQDVSVTGAIQAFDDEFRMMQRNIDEVKSILSGVNFTQQDIQEIQYNLDAIKANLTENTKRLNDVDEELRNTTGRVKSGSIRIQLLKDRVDDLKKLAKELQDNATNIQIQVVGGAFDKIKEAERMSQEAQLQVDGTRAYLAESERVRLQTDQLVNSRLNRFRDELNTNSDALNKLEGDVIGLGKDLSSINEMVCGEPAAPCSSLCGGGGCGRCGGISCNGAVTMAETALSLARQTEEILNDKTNNASNVLVPRINEAKRDAMDAKSEAQAAMDEASDAFNETESSRADLELLLSNIREFLIGNNTATPADVEKIANEVLAMEIPLKSDQIRELAEKINKAVSSLKDIDKILADTADSRRLAEELKRQAEDASKDAQDIRNTAQDVRDALDEARRSQLEVERAISQARADIQDAENDLSTIGDETKAVRMLSEASLDLLERLKDRLDDLNKRYTRIHVDTLEKAENAAISASDLASNALDRARGLQSDYQAAAQDLDMKHQDAQEARDLAARLKKRADDLYISSVKKMNDLKDFETNISKNERQLEKLAEEINRLNALMDGYLSHIRDMAQNYENC